MNHVEPSMEVKLLDADENNDQNNSVNEDCFEIEEEIKDYKITEIQDKPNKANSFMINKFTLNKLLQK